MKVVNLARRPFRNQRPVRRVALGLWILGALLVLANLWLWGGYLQGSSLSEDKLAALDRQIEEEEQRLDAYWQDLRDLKLATRNQQASYLNLLIHRRTFPWSALFDELEEVLPLDVYLQDVKPEVERDDPRSASAQRRSTAPRMTAREARRRARERAAQASTDRSDDASANDQPVSAETPEEADEREHVNLALNGFARTEDDMFELVDRLYQHPSFLDPNLTRESRENTNEKIAFVIRTVYLMPSHELPPVMVAEVFDETLPTAEDGGSDAVAMREGSTPGDLRRRLGGPAESSGSVDGSIGEDSNSTSSAAASGSASRVSVAPRSSRRGSASSSASTPGGTAVGRGADEGTLADQPARGRSTPRANRTTPRTGPRGSTVRERRDATRQAIQERRREAREAARGQSDNSTAPSDRTPPSATGTPRVLGWNPKIENFVPRFLRPAFGVAGDSEVWQEEGA